MALAGLAREAGGTYRIDGLAPAVARDVPCWGGNEGAIPLSRRLKAALDPDGTLAPGRFAGRI
jgi:FAD/FMN-containing dehydrogenase